MKRMMHTRTEDGQTEVLVHYEGALGEDALCGHDLSGDSVAGESWTAATETRRRVNCQDCLAIVRHVRGRRTS